MRNIIDFMSLNKNDELFEFEKDFINHLEIEHIFEYDLLFESNGIFNGCEDLVRFIIDFLSNKLSKNENNLFFKKKEFTFEISEFVKEELKHQGSLLESFKNPILEKREIYTFFDKLILKVYLCTNDTIAPSYNPHNNYNKDTDKLNECELIFDLPKNAKFNFYSNQVKKHLTHELTHAYEDYNRQRKQNVESLKDILDKKIYKEGIKRIRSTDGISQFIGKYIYCSSKQEQNAYLAEFNTILDERYNEIDLSGNIVKQLFNIIKSTEIYKTYYEVGSIIEMIEIGKLTNVLPQIAKEYNDASNSKLSDNAVKSNMINTWYKIKKKFETQIPKIVYKFMLDHKI